MPHSLKPRGTSISLALLRRRAQFNAPSHPKPDTDEEAESPLLQTLIVGLGRSGTGLHLPVLRKLRQGSGEGGLFAPELPVGYDSSPTPAHAAPQGLRTLPSLEAAGRLLDPERTLVHVCTPPDARAEVLRDLAGLGFRSFLVEKPLGADTVEAEAIRRVRDTCGLHIAVVAPWLHSTLTRRLHHLVESGLLGALRSIAIRQNKPRLGRTLAVPSHPSAFDVEPPHALGVALRLAGPASLQDASWTDARIGDTVARRMGSATLRLQHDGGSTTIITSDLVSPVRERSIRLEFSGGVVTGHYPLSGDDSYAQLSIKETGRPERQDIFYDEALTACVLDAYRGVAGSVDPSAEFDLQTQVVSLLTEAKCRAEEKSSFVPFPDGSAFEEGMLHAR